MCLCFVKRPKKAIFLQFWRFFLFCSPERPVFKILLSSYSVFFFGFSFLSSPSKFHFSWLFVHQPLSKTLLLLVCFSFIFLAFSFPNVCLFLETNFPNIPLFKPKLFSIFWLLIFLLLFLFLFFMVYVSAFLFVCWFCFW